MKSRQIRRSQRRAGRPSLESLEVRALMASASDLFARIDGVVPAGTGGDSVNVTISKTGGDFAFVGSGVSLGFLVQGTGGATLSPAAVQVRNAAGTLMIPAYSSNSSAPGGQSVAVERLAPGTYSVNVGGQGTVGGYKLDVTLVGDTVGLGHKVGTADGTTIRNLQGVDSTNPSYVAGADINRDGIIGSFDYLQYRGNLGAQTTIAPMPLATDLTPSPTTLADGRQVITSTATTIEGTTTPGAIVSVETGSDTSFGEGTTTAAADGHFSLPLTLAEGVDTITVRAAGPGLFGQRRLSTTVVSVDTQAPVVAVTSPAAGAVVSGNVDVLGSAVDAVAGLAGLTEQVDGGTAMNVTVNASGHFDAPTSFALDGSADGAHTVRFVATDLVGHSSTPLDVSFTLLTTASTPTVTIGSPSSGAYVNNDVHITGTAMDPSAKIASVAARVDGGASVPVSFVAATGAFDYTTTLALDGSADGAHTVVITATDAGGRSSSSSVSYHLKTTLPAAPKFMLSTSDQAGGPGIANPSLTTTAGRVSLVGLTDPNLTVTLTPTGATSLANSAGKFQFPGVALAPGLNDFTVTVTDLAGNTNQYQATVIRTIGGAGSNEVVRWNAIQLEAIRLDSTAPEAAARGLAMVGAAVLDSINAIDGTPAYYVKLNAAADASPQTAVATAAYKVLSYLYPAQQATLDAEYALALGELADGSAKADGVALGNSAGDAIVALRLHDGSTNYVDYQYGSGPNAYVATAPMYMVTELPQYANLTPFGMTSPSQFRAPAPLAINSTQWLADAQKTQSLGSAASTTRTADQTQQAKFWSDGTGTYSPPGHWNQIAETVAGNQGDSLSQDARLFAELNVSMADSAIAAWNTKYFYNTVRPITIIRAGDPADAPGLVADPNWTPLITTPPHPEYVSGHSTFSGSAAEVLDSFFGASTSFTIGSYILPGVTRSFSGFDQAAAEAGESRIYGGIHFEFSNIAGHAIGLAVADFDLKTFAVKSDIVAPTVVVTSPMAGSDAPGNVSIAGRVLDNLSGVATLTASIDGAAATPIAFDADGNFHIGTSFGLDGKSDGTHTVAFVATDVAGNVASPHNFSFTLDTKAPALAITGPVAGTLPTNATLAGTADGTGTPIASLSYNFDGGSSTPVSFDPATGAFSQVLDLSKLAPGNHALRLTAVDSAGNASNSSVAVTLAAPPALTLASTLPADGAVDIGVTVRPKVTFSRAIDLSTLTSASFFAMASGVALPAAIVESDDHTYAYLFFTDPVPGASSITITVDGSKIKGPDGMLLDAANTGTAGSKLVYTYTTVSSTALTNTSLSGVVADPGPDLKPSTFDDVKVGVDNILGTADDVYKLPIAGVTVSILGTSLRTITDAFGRYSFSSVPSGDVKLSLDGRTATNAPAGFYFPEMVMDMTLRPGIANTVMGSMGTADEQAAGATNLGSYLPRVKSAILQPVSMSTDTMIRLDAGSSTGLTPLQASMLTIDVPADSLIGPDGKKMSSGKVGISIVPPEIVKDMLPAGLMQHTFDITVQAPGITNFSTPAPMTFPNVFNAAPGTQLNFLSFDHTTGKLVIEGTATVSADGLSVKTDPGHGITHPGWHGLAPPGSPSDPPCVPMQHTEKVPPVPVDFGIMDYVYTTDTGTFQWGVGNAATKKDPTQDPCSTTNIMVTPLDVDVTVDDVGIAGQFLTGVMEEHYQLQPGQQHMDTVTLMKLIDTDAKAKGINIDQIWGVRIDVKGFQDDGSNNSGTGADLINKHFFVYRYVDAADAKSQDSFADFAQTVGNPASGVTRQRPIEYHVGAMSKPTLSNTDTTNFPDNYPDNFAFSPASVATGLNTLVAFNNPDGKAVSGPQTLTLRGDGTPQLTLDVNTAQLKTYLTTLAGANAAAPYVNSTDPVLFSEPERAMIRANVNAIAASVLTGITNLYAPFAGGLKVVDAAGAGAANSTTIQWLTAAARGSFGDSGASVGGDGIDDSTKELAVVTDAANNSQSRNLFLLSQAINQNFTTKIAAYANQIAQWPYNPIAGSPGNSTLEMTQAQYVNALVANAAHEVGHTIGAVHTATWGAFSPAVNEVQTITTTGPGPAFFRLNYNGGVTADITYGATSAAVQAALTLLPNLGANVLVASAAGPGPNDTTYTLTFNGKLLGVDVPQVAGAAPSAGLTAGAVGATTTQGSMVRNLDKDLNLGGTDGTTDVMMGGGNLDIAGVQAFQSNLSAELLMIGVKMG